MPPTGAFRTTVRWEFDVAVRCGAKAAVCFAAFVGVGAILLRNIAAMHLFGFSTQVRWTAFSRALGDLLCTYYYALPLVAVLLGHDLAARARSAAGAGSRHERAALSAVWLGRAAYLLLLNLGTFLVGLLTLAARLIAEGERLGEIEWYRVAWALVAVQLLGIVLLGMVGAAASLTPDPARAMLISMAVVTLTIVGVTMVSDMALFYSTGPMSAPGTPNYMEYIADRSSRLGLDLYLLSPTETYLTMATFLAGVKVLSVAALRTALGPLVLQLAVVVPVLLVALRWAPPRWRAEAGGGVECP